MKVMETKVENQYVDYRFGFPVVLQDVPMKKFRGEWVPDINANEFRLTMLAALIQKPAPLTGNELRFIRLWMEMTLQDFADECGVTHPSVLNWESVDNQRYP